ncbi:hypothetical protein [Streptomyces sp. BP-8]|uniref:Uncharacterized protein n=1 Tax=Streptomyces sirii TaxID=3127701 RepID=A0ABZ2QKU7_9ACTN
MEQTTTMPPEQESDLVRQVNQVLEQHPIKQVLWDLLSPQELRLAEQSALNSALHAALGEARATDYYPHRRPDGSVGHLMGT